MLGRWRGVGEVGVAERKGSGRDSLPCRCHVYGSLTGSSSQNEKQILYQRRRPQSG